MPSTQKLTLTSLSILAISLAGMSSSFAQDEALPLGADIGLDANYLFMDTDINKDGSLDREEFVAFAATKAQNGDEHYRALIVSGEYDNQFNTLDYNADGILTLEELKRLDVEPEMESETSGEEPIEE